MKPWQASDETPLLRADPWFHVARQTIRFPDGRVVDDYYQIHLRDCVEIVARDARGPILGLWRYKHGPRRVNLGLPAGCLEDGEWPRSAAGRELREECGLASESWSSLGAFHLDGNRSQARCHIWLADRCFAAPAMPSDDPEESRFEWMTLDQWLDHIDSGAVATLAAAWAVTRAALPEASSFSRSLRPNSGPAGVENAPSSSQSD